MKSLDPGLRRGDSFKSSVCRIVISVCWIVGPILRIVLPILRIVGRIFQIVIPAQGVAGVSDRMRSACETAMA
jgi:hypothetical protein